jgi:cytoskeleton protein RodZ
MPDDAPTTGIGATLRDARESQGRSLEDVALSLRARSSQLEALENESFASFGGDVYAKGFLRSYALELGLDPTPLLDTFRREVSHDDVHAASRVSDVRAPKERRGAPPAWIAWLLVIVVVVAGIAVLGSTDGRAPDQAAPDEPIGPPPATADDPDDDDDAVAEPEPEPAPEPAPEPEPDPEPVFEGVELFLAFESASWVRVIADEAPVLEQTVEAGETLQFEAEREIEVRFGNPGGVRATLNGEDLGPQGSPGQPITVRFTPEGVEAV